MSKITNTMGWHDDDYFYMLYSHSIDSSALVCSRCKRRNGDVMCANPEMKYIGYNRIRGRRQRKWTICVWKRTGICKQCQEDLLEE